MVINMKKKLLIFIGLALSIGAIVAIVYAAITLNKQQEIENSYLIELSYKELEEKINKKESFLLKLINFIEKQRKLFLLITISLRRWRNNRSGRF